MSTELIEAQESQRVAVLHGGSIPERMIEYAMQQGADIDRLEKLMAIQERWEATEARKEYLRAFAAFKDEAIKVIKGRKVTDGPLKGKSYAELHDVLNAVTPTLSKNGLSATWRITRDEKDWIEVTCSVRHFCGHSESVSLGGPPDAGGAKNAIQARASTVTYLERYTLKAVLGLAEEDDDSDGRGGKGDDAREKAAVIVNEWLQVIADCPDAATLAARKAECVNAYGQPDNVPNQIKHAFAARAKALPQQAAA